MTRILKYTGHACLQGLIGYAALIALFEAAYYAELAFDVRKRNRGDL